MSPAGIEPATLCLEGRCSIQLSYGLLKMILAARRFKFESCKGILEVGSGAISFWLISSSRTQGKSSTGLSAPSSTDQST